MKIYVDAQNGNNLSQGTQNAPLATIEAARDLAAQLSADGDVTVYIRGTFRLSDTILFTPEHSGKNGNTITYTSWGEKKAVITMAEEFTGFTLHDADKNIWKVNVGKGTHTRQAYFNEVKGIRARTVGYLKNAEYVDGAYYLCDNTELLDLKYPTEVDMVYHINWCNPRYLIDKIEKTDEGRVKITPNPHFAKYKSRIDFAGTTRIDATPGYLENAYEFLNEAGEWYIDRHEGFLYYIPRDGEDMTTMTVKLPMGERLIDACGENAENTVKNLTFDNICFEGTTWLKIDRDGGFHDTQNGHIREEGGRWGDRAPGAAVHFEHYRNIKMTNNTFCRLGVTGVEFMIGSKHVDFIGNEMYDISGVAITVDDVLLSGYPDRRTEDSYCEYVRVNNNYIRNVARDYKSAAAVSFAWPRHSQFNHNEICAVPYSGFHIGYGWEFYAATGTILYDVEVNYNYIHDIFCDRVYDGGGIYTLGASSFECDKTNTAKNNRMFGNYIANSWTCAMIYPDEGSTSWYVKDNVIDQSRVKFLENNLENNVEKTPWAVHMHASTIKWMTFENNYATCDYAYRYSMMNQVESNVEPLKMLTPGDWDNWCDEAKAIMEFAGIEDEYKNNFALDVPKVLTCDDRRQSLSLEKPAWAGFYVLGGKNKEYDLSNYNLTLWMDDPDAVTLTTDGCYIAHKKGVFEGEVAATFSGRTFMHHIKLECGDEIEEVALNVENLSLVAGAQVNLTINAISTFGNTKDVTDEAKFKFTSDSDIISIEPKDGRICIKSDGRLGSAAICGTIEYKNIKTDVNIPVKIVNVNSREGAELPYTEVDLTSGFKNPGKETDGGSKVSGSPNHYNGQFEDCLVAFDMSVHPGASWWPSLAICDSDFMGNYATNDCYMFMFKKDCIELQRFNQGARTIIFSADVSAVSGPAIDTEGIFSHHKRHSIVIGALNAETGTRLILNIDGKNVIDYTDESKKRIAPFGYLVVYNPHSDDGGMTFWKFSDMKKQNIVL